MKAVARGLVLLMLLVALSACRREQALRGRVIDYDSGAPVSGATVSARQSGWGVSDGSLVWDKSFDYRASSDNDGYFELRYAHGSAAHLWVEAQAYQRLVLWSEPSDRLLLPLKPRFLDDQALTAGHLVFGQYRDKRFFGWDFSTCRQVDESSGADLFPVEMDTDSRGRVVLGTSGQGGLVCQSFSELGAPAQPLTYSDKAPREGYLPRVTLDFTQDEGGVCFVRTRDGAHFAKFAYTPHNFAARADPQLQRDVVLRFVYNPGGGGDLRFQEESPHPSCGDPWELP